MTHFAKTVSVLALIGALAACSPSGESGDDAAMENETAATDMAANDEGAMDGGGDQAAMDNGEAGMDASGPMGLEQRLANADRPDSDVELDAMRHPAEVLTAAGVEPGWRVADLGAGGGYYSRVLSAAVGESGHVHTQNFDWIVERYPQLNDAMPALEAGHSNLTTHVTSETAPFEGMDTPLDAAFIVLLYHDLVLEGEDMAAFNQAVYDGLRPGGVFVVIDHAGTEGTGNDYINETHRIDEAQVRQQIEAAGFVLRNESDVLANPDDDYSVNVFDPSIRRQTDRFVLVYEKPE